MSERDAAVVEAAKLFHDTYERLAPAFGYKTRRETRVWNPYSKNASLMIAVMGSVLPKLATLIARETQEQK